MMRRTQLFAVLVCLSMVLAGLMVSCKKGSSGPVVDAAPFLPIDVSANNLVLAGGLIYAATGKSGVAIIDPQTRALVKLVPPPSGSGSVDDVVVADSKLFVLDARTTGYLSVFGLLDPRSPTLTDGPREVLVGPYAGIAAANGLVVVSGGTDALQLFSYSAAGRFGTAPATIDLGRGQPDILLSADGRVGFVSTHFEGDDFGLTIVSQEDPPALTKRGTLLLPGAGFTGGVSEPANFPIEMARLDAQTLLVAFGKGLAIVDVSDLDAPTLVRVVELGVEGTSVSVYETNAYIVGCVPAPMLVVVDLSSLESPQITKTLALPTNGTPTGIDVDASWIAIAANKGGVIVLDRANPTPPNPPAGTNP